MHKSIKSKSKFVSSSNVLDLQKVGFAIKKIISCPVPKEQRRLLAKKDARRYFDIHRLEQKPISKHYHKSKHICGWAIKLLMPDFLIGYPNLWDNLKTLRKHPHFRPLRMALAAWLIFALAFGGVGIYSLITASKIKAASWYDSNYGYRQQITINSSQVATTTTNGFVILATTTQAVLKTSANGGKVEKNDGSDIVFVHSDDSTVLDYHLESYSPTTGKVVAWIKVLDIASTTDKTFYMYYGNSGATDLSDENGTYGPEYRAVYHMAEDPSVTTDGSCGGGAFEFCDSTVNGKHANTFGSMTSSDLIDGGIGKAINFDGSNDYAKSSLSTLNAPYTIEAWGYFDNLNQPSGGNYDYIMMLDHASDPSCVSISRESDGTANPVNSFYNWDGAAQRFGPALTGQQWLYIVLEGTTSGNYTKLYIDGTAQTLDASTNQRNCAGTLTFGRYDTTGAHWLDGKITEMRIVTQNLHAMDVLTNYNYSTDNASFLTFGAEESNNAAPNTPTNSSPSNGVTNQPLGNITLTSSAFSDADAGDTHQASMWAVSSASDFSTIAWESNSTTTALTSIVIPASTLTASTTYYWRVQHQDNNGAWSASSTATTFNTSLLPDTPTNSSPANGATGQNLTLTLSASSFVDNDSGSSHKASWWLVRVPSDPNYSSPVYDSGATTTALTSITIPADTLSENTVYNWKVAYSDEHDIWSATSTETSFVTGVVPIVVVSIGATEYQSGETAKLVVQVTDAVGDPINNATTTLDFYDTSNNLIGNDVTMAYISGSDGLYSYSTTTSTTEGVYTYSIKTQSNGQTSYSSHTFHVSPALNTINTNLTTNISSLATQSSVNTVSTNVSSILEDTGTTLPAQITEATSSVASKINTATSTIISEIDANEAKIDTIDANVDAILIDTSTTIPNQITSASTTITEKIDTATSSIITEIQSASTTISNKLDTIESKIDTIDANVDTILSTLNTVDTNLDSVQSTVNALRASQTSVYTVDVSDVDEIQAGQAYRVQVYTFDYQSDPVNASSSPTIAIYDSTRANVQATTSLNSLGTGEYRFSTTTSSTATTGLWEAIITTNIGGSNVVHSDFFQMTGSPAQVTINSMSDLTVSSISANTSIQNEGNGAFEYQYEWCVVTSQTNQCGGDDDVYYASAAKLIQAGDTFTKELTATVPNTGDYWFKVVVYYGTEASGASRTFTAIEESAETVAVSSGGGGGGSSFSASNNTIYSEIVKIRNKLDAQSTRISRMLDLMGNVDPTTPGFRSLLAINQKNTVNLLAVQNKLTELRAVSNATRRIVEERATEPIIETFMKFNSVEINFLITNPSDSRQTIKFKSFLPEEVRPEHILNASGLTVDYDPNASTYFVSGDIALNAGETAARKVEIKDIWQFSKEEISSLRKQAEELANVLSETQYEAQAALLKSDIGSTLSVINRTQEESFSSPQEHIVVYRENAEKMNRAQDSLEKLKSLVVQSGASSGLVGRIGGIQTFATWGIILAIVFGFGLLAAIIFAMWRHQTMLAAVAMSTDKREIAEILGWRKKPKKVKRGVLKSVMAESVARRISKGASARLPAIWRLHWKKILIVVVALGALAIGGIVAMKFAPGLFGSREIKFESKETPVVAHVAPLDPEGEQAPYGARNSIGSKLVPETQENVKAFFNSEGEQVPYVAGNGKDEEKDEAVSESINPKLRITETPTGWLNVRDDSALDGKVITKVYPGEEYEYIDEQNGWYFIVLPGRQDGWVFGGYVQEIQD